jgi:hypothetical protein
MSGFNKAAALIGLISFVLGAGLAYLSLEWCIWALAPIFGLAAGYIGAQWQKDDPEKTARNTRKGARSGLVVGLAGFGGRAAVGLAVPAAALNVTDACVGLLVAGLALVFGGIGGWSWARHEHEVQTGYKPT